jgi:hypothetical protein
VVAAAELTCALEPDHVLGLLDDAENAVGAARVGADLAERDPLLDVADRVGERVRVLR